MAITKEYILNAISGVIDPYLNTDYASAGAVQDVVINGADVSLTIELGYPAESLHDGIAKKIRHAVGTIGGIGNISVNVATKIISHAFQNGPRPVKGVKNIIAISSGKGGVGKSTTTANLALALATEGARVGVLDADIYGPSQPTIMGVSELPMSSDGEHMEPLEQYGIQIMSIGFMMDDVQPLAWRAPMVTQALMQLLEQTAWKDLDYLLIDMPPGTGDIQLTLSQKAPVTGAVVVTTPQEIAVLDARKGLMMFQKMHVEVLGIIENMSAWVCPCCGEITHIFGQDGGKRMSEAYGVPSLGQVPINEAMCAQTDGGMPAVAAEPEGVIARIFRDIAHRLTGIIARKPKDRTGIFPPIRPVS
ncbi:MAG: iron-sulfur cluster carrier protein ApbC [Oxalobacter sp.]